MTTIDVRMSRARSALIMQHAFFGSLAMRLRVVARNDIETMATDGTHLFYSPAFLDRINDATTKFIVAHEVEHCALGHHVRRNGRDPKRWNIACDHVVNLHLKKAGFIVAPIWYCDARFEGFNAEQVYRILEIEEQQKQQQSQPPDEQQPSEDAPADQSGGDGDDEGEQSPDEGDAGDGKGNGETDNDGDEEGDAGDGDAEKDDGDRAESGKQNAGSDDGDDDKNGDGHDASQVGDGEQQSQNNFPSAHGDPGGCGEVLDAAPPHDKAAIAEAADEWEVFTRQAVNIARRQGEGKLPGFLEELVRDLDTPRTDWRDVLRRFVDPSATKDYSWTHPSKRLMSMGFYAPGLISDGINHVALAIDTSASIDHEWLRRFGGEAQAALDDGAIDKVTIVFADQRVTHTAEYVRGDQIDFTVSGRGGTEFAPTFAWLNENAPDVTAAIYFTDLDCSVYGEQPAYPVLWAAYGDPRMLKHYIPRVPFGEVIELAE
jgi:predicted metal-dependent peptidase